MLARLLFVLLLLAAAPALAVNGWRATATCGGATVTAIPKGETVYYCADENHGVAVSGSLKVEGGALLYITRLGDINGTGAGAVEAKVYVLRVTGGAEQSGDTTGDNVQDDLTLSGAANRRGLFGLPGAPSIVISVTVAPSAGQQAVFAVTAR